MTAVNLDTLDTPALLIDLDIVRRNLEGMQKSADKYGVALRPHIKTHKIPELAHLQMRLGATGVTVAKVSEAEVMAEAGIKDIFIANQVVSEQKLDRLAALSKKVNISVGLDSITAAEKLSAIFAASGLTIEYLIEINSGLNRCGVLPGRDAVELYQAINVLPSLRLKGIFTHAGQVYGAGSLAEVMEVSRHESKIMVETARALDQAGTFAEIVSVGSTPTMKVWQGYERVNEIRPGNYIFHDAIQISLGVATVEECALSIVATVISRPARERAVIDGGSKAFSSDRGAHGKEMAAGFGIVLGKKATLARLSEEHGIMILDPDEDIEIGDRVRIIPNHACAVVNLFDRAYGISNGEVVEEFYIAARGKSQ
ncbi:MAG: D-TA family PLP-dependent enzyme [Deltaproteobacteria bacterium]|nr:MAG: D-TA family PLP-dependent enzyme [Deltaproteobacteria bacterium]